MKPSSKRKLNYFLRSLFTYNFNFEASSEPIDVIIPIIKKDLKILPYCLKGIKTCVTNKINNIIIVSPQDEDILNFCHLHHLMHKDETSVLGFSPKDIHYYVNGINRSGWIFQQLLKLSGNIGNTSHYLVIDADHVLLAPHTFLTSNQQVIFYQSKEYHQPYYEMMNKLLDETNLSSLSFVDHKMLFSINELKILKERIHAYTGKNWIESILSNLDAHEISCFSEYETYGCTFPSEKRILLPWRNKNLIYNDLMPYNELVLKYGHSHRAITFPDYKKK